jgi:diketogulonate reductase-like aldo/keto reductase
MTKPQEIPSVTLHGGASMPLLGFGTWQIRGRRAYDAVRTALDVGYRHIDTATMYGNEAEVGRALRDSGLDRRDVFVTTKMPPSSAGRERATLAASLRDLDTEYVDLWLVHWPPSARQLVPVWREFVALRDEGKALSVGVSNYSVAQIDVLIRATGPPPAVNQIPWGPTLYDPGVLAASRDLGVVVEGYSPLKNTNLKDPVLAEIAARHGVTPAQVVLRWHIEHGVAVIPKSARPDRIAANIDLFGFALTAGEIALIDGMSAR